MEEKNTTTPLDKNRNENIINEIRKTEDRLSGIQKELLEIRNQLYNLEGEEKNLGVYKKSLYDVLYSPEYEKLVAEVNVYKLGPDCGNDGMYQETKIIDIRTLSEHVMKELIDKNESACGYGSSPVNQSGYKYTVKKRL